MPYLRPDGKIQVLVRYQDDVPVAVDVVLVSTQHEPDVDTCTIRMDIIKQIIRPVIPVELFRDETQILVNPTGRFVIGGPAGDSGLTQDGKSLWTQLWTHTEVIPLRRRRFFRGRPNEGRHRSAAYAARYIAKNIVAARID